MLRVETQQLDGTLICQLEGRFTGEGAEEVRRLVTPSGKRCFCLSRGSELSSLPRLRILGTFANGSCSRLLAIVSRTCKCQLIRTETGIVAADDQAHRTGHRARCRVIATQEIGIRGPDWQVLRHKSNLVCIQLRSLPRDIALPPKTKAVPIYGHGLRRPRHRLGIFVL
jgi:hypothetical protein